MERASLEARVEEMCKELEELTMDSNDLVKASYRLNRI